MFEVIIDTTNKCIFQCRYCATESFANGTAYLSIDALSDILLSLKKHKKDAVIYLGGGCFFCHPNWKIILENNQINKQNLCIDVPVSKYVYDIICTYHPKKYNYKFSMSLWGIGDTHDTLAGRKSYENLERFISYSIENDLCINISFVVTKEFINTIDEVIYFINNIKYKYSIYFHRFMPMGRGHKGNLPTKEELDFFLKKIKTEVKQFDKIRLHHTFSGTDCIAFRNRIYINHDGNVYGCGWINNHSKSVANIYNINLETILHNIDKKLYTDATHCILMDMN